MLKTTSIIILVLISLVLSLISIAVTVLVRIDCNLEFVSQILVISFIGIIATFVVINNYLQVAEIKNDLKSQLSKINEETDKLKDFSNHLSAILQFCQGIALMPSSNIDLPSSYNCFLNSILAELHRTKDKISVGDIENAINNMCLILHEIKKGRIVFDSNEINEIRSIISKIKNRENYHLIKEVFTVFETEQNKLLKEAKVFRRNIQLTDH